VCSEINKYITLIIFFHIQPIETKREKKSSMDWWENEPDSQPGISVFKGMKFDLTSNTKNEVGIFRKEGIT